MRSVSYAPIHLACMRPSPDVVKLLLDADKETVGLCDHDGRLSYSTSVGRGGCGKEGTFRESDQAQTDRRGTSPRVGSFDVARVAVRIIRRSLSDSVPN